MTRSSSFHNHLNIHSNRHIFHSITALHLSSKPSEELDTSMKGQMKSLWKNYGYIAIGTYFSVYFLTLGSIYSSLEFDIFNSATFGLDPVFAVQKFCDIVEKVSGSGALPGYIRDHPSVGMIYIHTV